MSAPPDILILAVLQRCGWTDHRTLRRELQAKTISSFYNRLIRLRKQGTVERQYVRRYGYAGIVEWRLKEDVTI